MHRLPLERFVDWPRRLSAFIEARRDTPYTYGSNDCGCFVLDGIRELTGVELLAPEQRPTSAAGALRFLVRNGYDDVEGMMTAMLGAPLATARLAQRGDVVSFEVGNERHLALSTGPAAATPGRDKLLWAPCPLWCLAWKVG